MRSLSFYEARSSELEKETKHGTELCLSIYMYSGVRVYVYIWVLTGV